MSGYKAVILAADPLPRYFSDVDNRGGTIRPERADIGVGVSGIEAIARHGVGRGGHRITNEGRPTRTV